MKAKARKSYQFFEQWARRNGMLPIQRVTDVKINGQSVGDILIADSGETINALRYPPMEGQEHRMFAFFRTGFAVDRPGDKTWFATYQDYPSDAFAEYASPEARQTKRVEEALQYATRALAQTYGVGLYEPSHRCH
jgi:hypothetical protein